MEQDTKKLWISSREINKLARENIRFLPLNFNWEEYAQSITDYNLKSRQHAIEHFLLYDQHLLKKYGIKNFSGYQSPTKKDMAVCISFFSPNSYSKPLYNLLTVINDLQLCGIPYFVIELLNKDQKSRVPNAFMTVKSDSIMFYKENLYNIIAKELSSQYSKFLFLDGDIRFDIPDWYSKTSELLDSNDIVQPMEVCYWPSRKYLKKSMAYSIKNDHAFDISLYHPGFAIGINTKNFLPNPFFDQALIGGGDTCFWLGAYHNKYQKKYNDNLVNDLYDKYLNLNNYVTNFCTNKKLSINYVRKCSAIHLEHGDRQDRKYIDRMKLIPPVGNNIHKNLNELYEWDNNLVNEVVQNYFTGRREDGVNIDSIKSIVKNIDISSIPPIQCLNLPRATERKSFIQDRWIKTKNMNIEFVDGIDKLEIHNLDVPYNKEKTISCIGREMSIGEIACAVSHLSSYKQALNKYPNAELFIFMEDDVYPHFNDKTHFFDLLLKGFYEHKDTECLLCHNTVVLPTYLTHGAFSAKVDAPIWGNQLTVFSKDGLIKIIESFKEIYCPIDFAWKFWQPKNRVALLYNCLCFHPNNANTTTYIGNEYRNIKRIEK